MLGIERARAVVALAKEVHHCARRLTTLKRRKPAVNKPNRRNLQEWNAERIAAEIRGQEIRQSQAIEALVGLLSATSQPWPAPSRSRRSPSSLPLSSTAISLPAASSPAAS